MATRSLHCAVAGLLCVLAACTAGQAQEARKMPYTIPPQDQILKTLKREHPRLLADAKRFEELKAAVASDAQLKAWYAKVKASAEKILTEQPSKYEIPDGLRLLATSRRVLDRMLTLGLVYKLEGGQQWVERAWAELDAAAKFKDWNPRHFLDTAEMTHAFAIGYDWFYQAWTPAQRQTLRAAILEKGFAPGLEVYRKGQWWSRSKHNWNQVCNGGLGMGALAIGDEEPAACAEVLHSAVSSLPLAMVNYGPDGAWAEGPGYWHYATKYNVAILAGLQTALGMDFGLSNIDGFALCGLFPIYAAGTAGKSFNYADAGDGLVRSPELWWLAKRFGKPEYAWHQKRMASGTPLDVLWYDPSVSTAAPKDFALDRYFRGTDVAMMRTSWDDPQAVYVGFKAGDNKANHSNLDLGSFVLDAFGVRWALDLGADNYNLPAYFGNKRWTYYRLRAEAHNTLVLALGQNMGQDRPDDPDQDPAAAAPMTRFDSKPDRVLAVADLTKAYQGPADVAKKVQRGVMLIRDAKVKAFGSPGWVLVQDEMVMNKPGEVWWFMHTPASVKIDEAGSVATLTEGDAQLVVRIISGGGGKLTVMDAKPLPGSPNPEGQRENKCRKLAIRIDKVERATIAVLLMPLKAGQAIPAYTPEIKPLAEW